MTIFYIEEADKAAAEALGSKSKEKVVQLDVNMPILTAVGDITLVAHTSDDATHIGGMTPKELAAVFSKVVQDKSKLEDIYLISCEAGLCLPNNPPLAQQFAEAMNRNKFNMLKVHAVTNPVGMPTVGMRVEVVTQVGLSEIEGAKLGDVKAFVYDNQLSENLDTKIADTLEAAAVFLNEGNNHAYRKKYKEYTELVRSSQNNSDYTKQDIFKTGHYKTAMQQPAYTFTAQGPKARMSKEVSDAIFYLETNRVLFSEEKHKKNLNKDIEYLQKNPEMDAKSICKYFKKTRGGLIKKNTSEYYALISPLIELLGERVSQPVEHSKIKAKKIVQSNPSVSSLSDVSEPLMTNQHGIKRKLQELAPHYSERLPELDNILKKNEILKELKLYKGQRENEWGRFHFNFLKLMSVFYFIQDVLTGTDHFNSKSREIKISATDKLIKHLESGLDPRFNSSELLALKGGRLGQIVDKYPTKLDGLVNDFTTPQKTDSKHPLP